MDASAAELERQLVVLTVLCPWERLSPSCHLPRPKRGSCCSGVVRNHLRNFPALPGQKGLTFNILHFYTKKIFFAHKNVIFCQNVLDPSKVVDRMGFSIVLINGHI